MSKDKYIAIWECDAEDPISIENARKWADSNLATGEKIYIAKIVESRELPPPVKKIKVVKYK